MKKKAFTLVELIVVVAILGILAAMVLPRFISISSHAIDSKEDAILGALKDAVTHKYLLNVTNDIAPVNAWPTVNPLTLLQQAPPNRLWAGGEGAGSNDDITWRAINAQPDYGHPEWWIHCPHWDAARNDESGATKGRMYIFSYGTGRSPAGRWTVIDKGH